MNSKIKEILEERKELIRCTKIRNKYFDYKRVVK